MTKRITIILTVFFLLFISFINVQLHIQQSRLESDSNRIRTSMMEEGYSGNIQITTNIEQRLSEDNSITLPVEDEITPVLKKTPNRVTLSEIFSDYGIYEGNDFLKAKAKIAFTNLFNSNTQILNEFNLRYDNLYRVDQYLRLKDFDAAEYYLWKEIESGGSEGREYAALLLIRFESDPQVSTNLLHLACESNWPSHLSIAITFCDEMDSPELREYYFQRLYDTSPELAREYSVSHKK